MSANNMELNNEMMSKVTGGIGAGIEANYRFSIGDPVTMIGKVGNITGRSNQLGMNFYSVHWIANEYGPEGNQNDIPEEEFD